MPDCMLAGRKPLVGSEASSRWPDDDGLDAEDETRPVFQASLSCIAVPPGCVGSPRKGGKSCAAVEL